MRFNYDNEKLSINKSLLVDCIEYYTYNYNVKLNDIDLRISTIQLEEQIKQLILNNLDSLEFYIKEDDNCYLHINKVTYIDDLK